MKVKVVNYSGGDCWLGVTVGPGYVLESYRENTEKNYATDSALTDIFEEKRLAEGESKVDRLKAHVGLESPRKTLGSTYGGIRGCAPTSTDQTLLGVIRNRRLSSSKCLWLD